MKVKVCFFAEETGKCQQIFKELNGNRYYCRIEGAGWYTTNRPYFETDCPTKADIVICDQNGNIITSDVSYPFMKKFVTTECKEYLDKYNDYYAWKKYVLEDKEKFGYKDYDDNWLFFETKVIGKEVEKTLNYLGQEIKIVKKAYKHNISGKQWTEFMAVLDDTNIKILGYDF